ncbi:LysR family transcriptional regulator [Ancylobacter terrae]|uniref:LysR family transcriptional regulator n=1 Tax=Ancylobacter sp. sgz301288 TaxID=3342077 RepID=UPI00385BAC8B
MNIQFRHIRAFVTVALEKSFARAAARLNVSQPALSQTIIQLEEDVGFPLFARTTRRVELTEEGQLLFDKARHIQRALEDFAGEAHSIQLSLKNELRVGFLIGTAVEYIPAIVREFERLRPNARLALSEFDFTDPTAGLRDHKVDCGIIRPPVELDDIQVVELAREPCVACLPVGHTLTTRKSVMLADILAEPIIGAPGDSVWRDYWLAMEHRGGRMPRVVLEAATVESELQAVATGKGISISAHSTAKFYSRPGVEFRIIEDMPACRIGIGYRDTSNRLLADFISIVRSASSLFEAGKQS